jgi:polyhydroxyalkanoate synthesis regulator phasin
MNRIPAPPVHAAIVTLALILWPGSAIAQQAENSTASRTSSVPENDLDRHLDELTSKLDSMRQQLINSQNEMDELRGELRSLREQLAAKNQTESATRDVDALRTSVAQLQDESQILQAQVKQHEQTKVESSSKFPVRINGALLVTSIFNSGEVDNVNLPIVAETATPGTPTGSLSATASQTLLGIDASGPHFWGAKSYADVNVDFWGGASSANYTSAAGIVRLRTLHARLEWPDRSLGVALEGPLISPLEPTSWVTVAEPALAWSGNLWSWAPQLEFKQERIFHQFNVGVALIDPPAPNAYTQGQAAGPSAAERSRQPGYESRIGYASSWRDHPINFGAGGYYARQSYPYDHHVDAWAGSADWDVVFSRLFRFSGEAYRGKAIAGLGGGTFKDYVSNAANHYLDGLNAAGGWAQAKVTFAPSLEANVSAGLDNAYAADLRDSDQAAGLGPYASLARNATLIANVVYRPRTYLLLSTEFRQINSRWIAGQTAQDRVFGVTTGYIF